ncbi:MAG: hypothetical protein IJ779_04080, partial [Ruminococcus sp.]|nr:hypothetical protein [Ruminococcus sp.]
MRNRFPALFVVLLLLLLADSGACAAMLFKYNNTCGLICMIIAAVLILGLIVLAFVYGRNAIKHVSKMNAHLE